MLLLLFFWVAVVCCFGIANVSVIVSVVVGVVIGHAFVSVTVMVNASVFVVCFC